MFLVSLEMWIFYDGISKLNAQLEFDPIGDTNGGNLG
jgi:hypothetical protein